MALKSFLMTSAALAALLPQVGFAQDSISEAEVEDSGTGLNVILVTAQFREEDAQSAAVST